MEKSGIIFEEEIYNIYIRPFRRYHGTGIKKFILQNACTLTRFNYPAIFPPPPLYGQPAISAFC